MRRTGTALAILAGAAILLPALFELRFAPQFALPREVERPDPAREAEFRACYEARDRAIHASAFGTIDNPDVQREYIAAHRADAERDCRERYPQRLQTVREPFRFGLVEFEFRY